MITAADSDYHERDLADRAWTETTVLLFTIPEERIIGNAYVLARPNMGVTISTIIIAQGFCRQPFEIDFTDPQMHLPAPGKFSKYTLENGLSVEATAAPRDYQFSYRNALDACSFDLAFEGIGEPFDILDPGQNPVLGKETFKSLGDQWTNGHFEMIGHVTGTLELRGKRYQVDSYEGMDHSWGPRVEEGKRAVGWIPVAFGPDLGMHIAMALDIRGGHVYYDDFRFGHVIENGVQYGLVDAIVEAEHEDFIAMRTRIRATDVRGKTFEFTGRSIAGHPFYQFNPCSMAFQSLMSYDYQGRVGHGVFTDVFGVDFMAERMSRHGRKR